MPRERRDLESRGSISASPDEDWRSIFRAYLRPRFVLCSGKLFIGWRKRDVAATKEWYALRPPTTGDENTSNAIQFLFPVGNTPEERFRENFSLASATRVVWGSILKETLPQLRFTLFVSNEYEIVFDGVTGRILSEELRPTLRLWTFDRRTHAMMRATYRPHEAGPDRVFWRQRREEGLFDVRKVLAVMAMSPRSPKKAAILRRYYSDDRLLQYTLEA